MRFLIFISFVILHLVAYGQGRNHQWLLGSYNFLNDPKGRMLIDNNGYSMFNENRKMPFKGTQGNISDEQGNLLMASNGVWIMNATGDTMLNGSGLNPGGITPNWPFGLPMVANNVILPYPGDSSRFLMVHHSATDIGPSVPALELFYTIIDMSLDNALGGVITKNNLIFTDTLNWGIGVCRHANGRDWWIVMQKDASSLIHKLLLTPQGITLHQTQILGFLPLPTASSAQLTFSPDGSHFISMTYNNSSQRNSYMVVADFDRCTGMFSNTQTIQLTSGSYLWGLAFSPSGQYAYASSSNYIFQVDVNTMIKDTVAVYDGFISPPTNTCCATTFDNMYLAANGKIYVSSGSGVQHITEMNYPDSSGSACDVQQHAIDLLTYRYLRAVPHHPNYYLGAVAGSVCDSLSIGIQELQAHDFRFSVSPNPSTGNFRMIYLLPQNQSGVLEVYDVNGRRVFAVNLPPWSSMQEVELPSQLAVGVYSCVVSSGGQRGVRKVVVIKN